MNENLVISDDGIVARKPEMRLVIADERSSHHVYTHNYSYDKVP